MPNFRVSNEFADFISAIGLSIVIFSMFFGMLFLLNDGSAPAIILYLIVFGIIVIWVGLFIRVANE